MPIGTLLIFHTSSLDTANELTVTVDTPLLPDDATTPIITPTPRPLETIMSPTTSLTSSDTSTSVSLNNTPTKLLVMKEKKHGHRRSFSHDYVDRYIPDSILLPECYLLLSF